MLFDILDASSKQKFFAIFLSSLFFVYNFPFDLYNTFINSKGSLILSVGFVIFLL